MKLTKETKERLINMKTIAEKFSQEECSAFFRWPSLNKSLLEVANFCAAMDTLVDQDGCCKRMQNSMLCS